MKRPAETREDQQRPEETSTDQYRDLKRPGETMKRPVQTSTGTCSVPAETRIDQTCKDQQRLGETRRDQQRPVET